MKRFLMLSMALILAGAGCVAHKPPTLSGPEKIAEKKSIAENSPNNEWCWLYLGEAYEENGQYREAIQAYNQAASKPRPLRHIEEWGLYAKISQSYEALGEFDAAISARKRSIEIDPERVESYTALSTLYARNKQYDDAVAAGRRALELQPGNSEALAAVGAALSGKKQYREAQAILQQALQASPMDFSLYFLLGDVLDDQNAFDDEILLYQKGIEASAADTKAKVENSKYVREQIRFTQKEREKLRATYTKDMEVASATPFFYGRLARAYYAMGKYAEALVATDKGVDLLTTPDGIGITYAAKNGVMLVTEVMHIGPAQKAGVQVGDTIKGYGDGLMAAPGLGDNGILHERHMRYLIREYDNDNISIQVLRRGVEIKIVVTRGKAVDNKAADLIAIRSLVYRRLNEPARAASEAELAAGIDPSSDWVRFATGLNQFDRGQLEAAVKTLSAIKESVSARLVEATAYARLGKMEQALDAFAAVDPAAISAKNVPRSSDLRATFKAFAPYVSARREKARAYESKGQYREALFELSAAMRAADADQAAEILAAGFLIARKSPAFSEVPEEARKYAIRSEVQVKEGNFEGAAVELQKAVRVAPYVAQFYYNLALVNAEAKKYREAVRNMKTYLAAAPDGANARAARDEIVKWEFMIEKGK
jgi:tetratricopeptide (TPR) repeat protein